ncbi:uncharacterized protein LOC130590167 [Beta vulgaris subsp. vulgaris]|uniref:uncharacterized protein LOC130590167 n=1 Tax=Beta vulgaris subsp. vulgaris TaxID=3555 RepID=UPI0025478192|nr:uncharacterized protein LOC130590167 [Beta vulgaris subsp. vulgaris]
MAITRRNQRRQRAPAPSNRSRAPSPEVADETAGDPRLVPMLSARNQHVLEETNPREAASAVNLRIPRERTAPTPGGPPLLEHTSPQPVTQQDLQQLADRLSDNFERGLRALMLNFQVGGEGTSNRAPPPPRPQLTVGRHQADNQDQPQVIALDPPGSSRVSRRAAQAAPGKDYARHVINERYRRNGNRDAMEVLNERRAQSKAKDVNPSPNREQREPREREPREREPREREPREKEPREREKQGKEPQDEKSLGTRKSLGADGAIGSGRRAPSPVMNQVFKWGILDSPRHSTRIL